MEEELTFSTREKFRAWLRAHGEAGGGVWLVFGKPGGRKTLKAAEALEVNQSTVSKILKKYREGR